VLGVPPAAPDHQASLEHRRIRADKFAVGVLDVLSRDMQKNIIERAYEIAPTCGRIEEVRAALRREGYSNVDAHLAGRVIRADLTKLFNRA
jgi:hypothetical protein